MKIREATESDLQDVLHIEAAAFGYDKEANLVKGLLSDSTAMPLLSLLAVNNDGEAVGHILFTTIRLTDTHDTTSAMLLAPLAVMPHAQDQGVGGELIKEGLRLLSERGVDLVFVLGHPGYYPRYGFQPAGMHGFEAPYPIPDKDAGAWMVQELIPGAIERASGKVICADTLDQPEHWRE
ncbi:MAG TPA: N-acetyltransferase [Syntrophales bacterium]|nr:N-acetyltransferase [Syntrophales bacterium]HPQ45248.1 N-acetyltransferase [Syntrophales bacterium]